MAKIKSNLLKPTPSPPSHHNKVIENKLPVKFKNFGGPTYTSVKVQKLSSRK